MEKYRSKEISHETTEKNNQALRKIVFITALLTSSVLSGDTNLGQYRDLSFTEEMTSKIDNNQKTLVKKTGKNLSSEILEEYRRVKSENGVNEVKEETENWVTKILKGIGFFSESKEKGSKINEEVDIYLLSRVTKEYIDKHKVTIIGNDSGKAFLLTYYKKPKSKTPEIIYLPISPINPKNEILEVHKGTTTFSVSPYIKSNGYNTEYNISSNKGGELYQLSILYPAEYGEYAKELEKKKNLEAKRNSLKKEENDLKVSEKSKKVKDKKRHKLLYNSISEINTELKELDKKLLSKKDFKYFSYIPYTHGIDTYRNQKKGLNYLVNEMKVTYNSIFKQKLGDYRSSINGLSIKDAIPENFPLVLNVIERMDFLEYFEKDGITLKDKKTIEEIMTSQINRSLTTFGLNLEDSFNWQKSPVGAEGVGQIMPGTYNLFRNTEKYGVFLPESNFSKAARDHETTFRLQISHFDDQIIQIPPVIKQNWNDVLNDKHTRIGLNALLAAGYNGNMKKVVSKVFLGIDSDAGLEIYKKRLHPENIIIAMKKYRDNKISLLESEINITRSKIKLSKLSKHQIEVLNSQIKEKQDEIIAINNTYKESMTYVLKTEFVVNYLMKNFPNEFKYN
ncbi:MAG: hypothetical protein PHV23_01670 [Candidatus Gracilibacteria bacterium]|nr:hypothetical protein [Candidatus Gracilibacteria bacterium]